MSAVNIIVMKPSFFHNLLGNHKINVKVSLYLYIGRSRPENNTGASNLYKGPGWKRSSSTSTSMVPADSSVTFS